jgi:hypothetical protein
LQFALLAFGDVDPSLTIVDGEPALSSVTVTVPLVVTSTGHTRAPLTDTVS